MEGLVKIAVLDSEAQAQVLDALLDEQEIPHLIRTYRDSAYDGLFQAHQGWGHLEAPREYKERILHIMEELSQGNTEDGEAE